MGEETFLQIHNGMAGDQLRDFDVHESALLSLILEKEIVGLLNGFI
jgi:hypothetical protein